MRPTERLTDVDLLVGIDMGTSSSKGVLVTPDGVIVASHQVPHEISLPRPGWAEVDAEKTWWADVCRISKTLLDSRPPGSRVSGICVSGVGPCLALCDENVSPVRPAILYGIDTRASVEIDELTALFGAENILARGGKPLSSQAVGPKIEWVRKNEPDVFARAKRWYGSNSYIAAKLTGEYIHDHPTASACDPLYSIRDFRWNEDWAQRILAGLPLPRLVWPAEVVGTVHARAAGETGIPEGTPVVAGTLDALADTLSIGVRHPGDLMLMYGSTMFLVQVLEKFHTSPALWTTAGVPENTYTLAGGTATAGTLTNWLQKVTGGASFDELMTEAAAVPPGSDGLLVLPYLAGERTPVFDPDARGVVAGLTLRHGRGHLFRASYEGIAFGTRQILDMFDSADAPVKRVVAVGGGLRSPIWAQALSDITGRTQLLPDQTIGASHGDGLLAAIGVGLVPPETDWATITNEIKPNPDHREMYDNLYEMWLELYPATREQMHRLARLG